MLNLRAQAENDLGVTLEGDWGVPVQLMDPDGNVIVNNLSGSTLKGQVLFDTVRTNPDTGADMVTSDPIVVLRRSNLSRTPKAGETWHVKIPASSISTTPTEDYIISKDRPPEGGKSLGFIRLYLQRAEQK